VRVLVVAAADAALEGAVALVEAVDGAELAGSTTVARGVEEAARLEPDVVLVDVAAGDDAALDMIEQLRAGRDAVPVVALMSGAGTEDALLAGAAAAITAGVDEASLGATLEAVAHGLAVVSRDELMRVLSRESTAEAVDVPVERLTPREAEVLQLLARGNTNAEIARALGISPHTAKFHVGTVLAKLGARSRAEAVARASRLGWIVV
jgi:two-component system nitrate/nitrite response regulator NarL